jgi:predicted nuclease of predicted toxin-antitoxin system
VRWLADECVDGKLVAELRTAGENVLYVAEIASGITDGGVIDLARRDRRVLLTEDKDFGDLVFRQHRLVWGRIASHAPGTTSAQEAAAASRDR